jgi:hypothetical protein
VLEVLKCVREQGCEWNKSTCNVAAAGCHLEVLKWAKANGCEWDASTCYVAAFKGRLKVLKWANGCPWEVEVLFCASDLPMMPCRGFT